MNIKVHLKIQARTHNFLGQINIYRHPGTMPDTDNMMNLQEQ